MTYAEAIDFLFGIRLFGQKLGLETMRELLRRLGDPQQSLRFIHIAGTNGKGSVAAMTDAVLTAAGYRTGLYTSPHLVSFCERFQINGRRIAETDVVRLVERLQPVLAEVGAAPGFRPPTFFEVVTALALEYFREQQVELVIWETGLGGRLDATNVVTPVVSVITNITFDHMQYLGDTLASIAAEKCGIIKPGVPVVTGATEPAALDVIRAAAAEAHSPLTVIGQQVRVACRWVDPQGHHLELAGTRGDYGQLTIPLAGEHQAVNCATAVAAIEAAGLAVPAETFRAGLARTRWPGRFQIVRRDPTVVLDGAHNAAAAASLAATLQAQFGGQPLTLILGVLRDKDFNEVCHQLAPLARRIYCVPVQSERTSDPADLARASRAAHPAATVVVAPDLATAYAAALAEPPSVIVITGSLFLVGEALALLVDEPSNRQERALQ